MFQSAVESTLLLFLYMQPGPSSWFLLGVIRSVYSYSEVSGLDTLPAVGFIQRSLGMCWFEWKGWFVLKKCCKWGK